MAGRALRMTSRVTGSRRIGASTDIDDQFSRWRRSGHIAGEQQRGGGVLLYDGRPGHFLLWRQPVAVVDRAAYRARGVLQIDLTVANNRIAGGGAERRELRMLAPARGGHAHV